MQDSSYSLHVPPDSHSGQYRLSLGGVELFKGVVGVGGLVD